MDNTLRTLLQALTDIQAFDGGYERAWDIAEKAMKEVGFNSGYHAKQALRQAAHATGECTCGHEKSTGSHGHAKWCAKAGQS